MRLRLIGGRCNRDAIGSTVEVTLKGRVLRRTVMPTRSYLSQTELPVTFGLGRDETIERLKIIWADGSTQNVPVPGIDRSLEIHQDDGPVEAGRPAL